MHLKIKIKYYSTDLSKRTGVTLRDILLKDILIDVKKGLVITKPVVPSERVYNISGMIMIFIIIFFGKLIGYLPAGFLAVFILNVIGIYYSRDSIIKKILDTLLL